MNFILVRYSEANIPTSKPNKPDISPGKHKNKLSDVKMTCYIFLSTYLHYLPTFLLHTVREFVNKVTY